MASRTKKKKTGWKYFDFGLKTFTILFSLVYLVFLLGESIFLGLFSFGILDLLMLIFGPVFFISGTIACFSDRRVSCAIYLSGGFVLTLLAIVSGKFNLGFGFIYILPMLLAGVGFLIYKERVNAEKKS